LIESQNQRFKIVNEAIGGIKDIKLFNNSCYYLKKFDKKNLKYANNLSVYMVISQVPRYILETIAFGGIILITLFFIITSNNTLEVIPILAMYAFAGYRLMPALQLVFSSLTSIKAMAGSLDILHNDLCNLKLINHPLVKNKQQNNYLTIKLTDKLKLDNLTFAYPNTNNATLKNLTLSIPANSIIGFVGTTGSGKTTTVDLILGLFQPKNGQLLVDDVEINHNNLREWQNNLGYVPQHIYLTDDTIINNIAFGVSDEDINLDVVQKAAKIANIHNFIINELPKGYQTITGERGVRLSGGQRQRIGIARALYRDPQILIFDEATSALDGITETAIMDAIHNISSQKTIIIIAHRVTTLKECDMIHMMENGQIVASGSYNELLKTNAKFQEMAKSDNNRN
jgi:ABC-type multidrug transport system fused ATPase/permease subunit